jgi:uncharacterized protein
VKVCALCPGFIRTEFHDVSGSVEETSKVPSFAWLNVNDVAASGLKAIAKGHALDIPGPLYKGLGAVTNSLPRTVTPRVMGRATRPK